MRRAVVLQHIACEPPGIYEDVLVSRGVELVRAELDEGDEIPDLLEADLVVAMGGPMSVNDEAAHPWLAAEKGRIAGAVRAGVPYFGVCLGAQLLAASLGATVYAGELPEVGILPVQLTEAGAGDGCSPSWRGASRRCSGMATPSSCRPARSTRRLDRLPQSGVSRR